MSKNQLFSDFQPVSSKQWKQQIQFDLKGADYNETLVWESPEGIKVKPFYHSDEFETKFEINTQASQFKILQNIFVHDVSKSNKRALETLNRGAESIRFTVENEQISIEDLMQNLPSTANYYFKLNFLSVEFNSKLNEFAKQNNYSFFIQNDPISQLISDGNWFENLEKDFEKLNIINSTVSNSPLEGCPTGGVETKSNININGTTYQNAGANIVQQLAYILGHCNEYFNRISNINQHHNRNFSRNQLLF